MVGSRQEEFAELLRNTKDMSRFESGLDVGFRSCSDLWHYLENTAVYGKAVRPAVLGPLTAALGKVLSCLIRKVSISKLGVLKISDLFSLLLLSHRRMKGHFSKRERLKCI